MSRVRGPDAAQPLVAVERDAVGAQLLDPECLLEALAERERLGAQLGCPTVVAEGIGEVGGAQPGGVDVGLELTQRDRALGQDAVGVEHRVVRVLPALVREAGGAASRVLDEAVAIGVGRTVDPRQRALDVRPQLLDEGSIRRLPVVRIGQDDEEGGRVMAAVVARRRAPPSRAAISP